MIDTLRRWVSRRSQLNKLDGILEAAPALEEWDAEAKAAATPGRFLEDVHIFILANVFR